MESGDSDSGHEKEEEGQYYEEITEVLVPVEEIISLYATPDVLSKCGLLLGEYEFNPPEVNRKQLHSYGSVHDSVVYLQHMN